MFGLVENKGRLRFKVENAIELGWQLGVKVVLWGLGISLGVLAVSLLAIALTGYGEIPAVISVFALIIFGFIGAIGLFPYKTEYWQLYRVSGQVESVSNVLAEDGGELTRQPVVTLDSVDRDVVIDDPRAANLQGKQVDLTCSKSWHYQAADRYSCKIYSIAD